MGSLRGQWSYFCSALTAITANNNKIKPPSTIQCLLEQAVIALPLPLFHSNYYGTTFFIFKNINCLMATHLSSRPIECNTNIISTFPLWYSSSLKHPFPLYQLENESSNYHHYPLLEASINNVNSLLHSTMAPTTFFDTSTTDHFTIHKCWRNKDETPFFPSSLQCLLMNKLL